MWHLVQVVCIRSTYLSYHEYIYRNECKSFFCGMFRCGGAVYVQGREQGFGLATQEPWIQHATVRDNILFGKDFDSGFYQTVLGGCALIDDLNVSSFVPSEFL